MGLGSDIKGLVLVIRQARRMYCGFFVGICVLIWSGVAVAEPQLKPFVTDGCSMMLDGLPDDSIRWRHCCVAHDKDYWLGGTETERRESDKRIGVCISEAAAPLLGDWVEGNVRWGGSPYWPTTYRWGYGWPFWNGLTPRGYKVLTEEEQAQAEVLIPAADALLEQEIGAAKKPVLENAADES